MSSPRSVHELLTWLLHAIDPDARLVECTESADGRHFKVRIDSPDETGTSLLLPRPAVLTACTDQTFRKSVGNILRAELRMQRARGSVDEFRQTLPGVHQQAREPVCPRCSATIAPGVPVRFEHGEILHIDCGG